MDAAIQLEQAEAEPQRMPCMEVWGGNQSVDYGVIMAHATAACSPAG